MEAVSALLIRIAELLKIPEACKIDEDELSEFIFAKPWNDTDDIITASTTTIQREQFLHHSPALLSLALSLLRLLPSHLSKPSLEDTILGVNFILAFGRFTDVVRGEAFISSSSPPTATRKHLSLSGSKVCLIPITLSEICDILLAPSSSSRYTLINHILSKTFPPLFKPHPKLNPSTGRALARPKGGEKGLLDWYEESETKEGWRREAGMGNVIKVVIERLEVRYD